MFEGLLLLVFVLAIVTVVGHGLWIACAWLYRLVQSAGDEARYDVPKPAACPRCGLPLAAGQCGACAWPAPYSDHTRHSAGALDALAAQIRHVAAAGVIDPDSAARLLASIAEERTVLARQTTATIAQTAPLTAAAEEIVAAEVVEEIDVAPRPTPSSTEVVHPVASFAARRERAERGEDWTAEPSTIASQPTVAAEPRRTWADLLSAFMEERNIRWGELVGGLLIVCCSIALVISFWSEIAERPLLKFLLFNGVTAGLFGIGFYSEYRWRLHTTSQGVLTIACLLVPLNFMAIAAFTSAAAADSPITIAGEVLSVALFSTLVFAAGRVLVPTGAIALAGAVILPSVAQLLVRRFVGPDTNLTTLWTLVAIPVACYWVSSAWPLSRAASGSDFGEAATNRLFKFLGVASFAAVLPFGLLLAKTGQPMATLHELSLAVSLLGAVPLAYGLLVWQRLEGVGPAGLRTAGTSIGVLGAGVSLAGLFVAWPHPAAMLPTAAIEFVVFTAVAWRLRLPAAHWVSAACLTTAYLLGVYLFEGRIAWRGQEAGTLAEVIVSGSTGVLLVPLVLGYAAVAFGALRRWGRGAYLSQSTGGVLACTSGALAAISVGLVTWFGFGRGGDPIGASWVYLVYAAGSIAVSARNRYATVAWVGALLLLAAVWQGTVFRYGGALHLQHAELAAMLLYCTACALIASVVRITHRITDDSPLERVLWTASFGLSIVAAVWLVVLAPSATVAVEAGYWLWLAALWLAVAVGTGWLPAYTLMQIALVMATLFGVGVALQRQAWFAEDRWPWLDPRSLQAVGIGLSGLGLAWIVLRFVGHRVGAHRPASHWTARAAALLWSPWLSVDRWVSGALIVLVVGIGSYAVLPGVQQELSPRASGTLSVAVPSSAVTTTAEALRSRPLPVTSNFERPGVPRAHAAGWGSWLLLGTVLAVVAATAVQQRSSGWLLAFLATTAVVCPLVAGQFDNDVAVASALRWTSVLWLAVASIPVWARGSIARIVPRGWNTWDGGEHLSVQATSLVLVIGLAAPLAMIVRIGASALARASLPGDWPSDTFRLALICGIALALAGAFGIVLQGRLGKDLRGSRPMWPVLVAAMALVAGVASIVGVAVYQAGSALVDHPILGPEPGSIFARMGAAASYGVPILIAALVLVGYAVRERSSGFALAGGLTLSAAATTAYLLNQASGGIAFDAVLWIRLAQLNAVVGACYALGWLATRTGFVGRGGPREPLSIDFRLGTQIAIAPALLALVLGWSWADLFLNPKGHVAQLQVMVAELVDAWGWISLGLAAVVSGAAAWAAGRRVSMAGLCGLLTAVAVMAAALAGRWDIGDRLAYNTLLTGHMLIVGALLAVAWRDRRVLLAVAPHAGDESSLPTPGSRAWIAGSGAAIWIDLARVVVLVMAVREMTDDLWWPVGGFAVLAATGAASAWVFQRRRYLYDAALMLNVAGSIAWLDSGWQPGFANFVLANVVLLALPVALWIVIERMSICRRESAPRFQIPPMHRTATRFAIGVLAVVAGVGLYRDAQQMGPFGAAPWMPWAALAATALAAVACLWEGPARNAIARLYLLGLVAVAMLVDVFDLPPQWLLWTGTMVLAAYALATSYLWSRRAGLRAVANRLHIPTLDAAELDGLTWLVPCNLFLVSTVVFLTGLVELTEQDVSLRVLAAQAVLAQIVSVAMVARGDHRGVLQTIALSLGAVGGVMFGWAWLVPGASGTLLHALAVLAAALAAVAALYGLGLNKLLRESSDWLAPARRLTPWLTALTAASIVAIIGTEVNQFSRVGTVAIAWPATLAVGLTLGGLCAAALAAALLPGRDPLNLSERGRTLYVYGAEVCLALLFAHVRLTMPWLFAGFFQQYWPLVVMAVAFAGVGFAELCRRYRQNVLAEPIENTGALLPVLPVLGFWATDSQVDYSMLLLAVGVLYAGLSIARRSFGFGILAALAANGGLWYFFDRQQGLGFLDHPQVWLIPPALCVLAAAYLNRSQLTAAQMTALRYITSMSIYLSSTADIFLNGVAQAPWLPLVLGGLAIVGILAGIALRVRAFLMLGIGFLGLALCTIIWHAAVDLDQTWILYATGIVTGVLIIALFAMFEKKRREVLDVFERIKQWEA